MVSIQLGAVFNINDYDELARMFLPRGEYELIYEKAEVFEGVPAKLEKARAMYRVLSGATGRTLPWGVLTGVKPVKLYAQLAEPLALTERSGEARSLAEERLKNEYLVSDEKVGLLRRVYERQASSLPVIASEAKQSSNAPKEAVAVYIGIPFCPTRCAYCTFTSGVGTEKQMGEYLAALYRELAFVGKGMKAGGLYPESVYIGGGTPTALTASMLEELLARVTEELRPGGAEFTVEAGRPDTITYEKAACIARFAGRVSVNPQTMNDATLERIGRGHKADDVIVAFENVRGAGLKIVNADVIAGLPGEELPDFLYTLGEVLRMGAENITIHTLALKKGSRLREKDGTDLYYKDTSEGVTARMLREADAALSSHGMGPYYLYRQKQTVGNLENVGYAKQGAECLYNMRMMQEKQTVIALGAGAVSKAYYPETDRIERVFNMADTGLYIARIAEMLERKRALFPGNHYTV